MVLPERNDGEQRQTIFTPLIPAQLGFYGGKFPVGEAPPATVSTVLDDEISVGSRHITHLRSLSLQRVCQQFVGKHLPSRLLVGDSLRLAVSVSQPAGTS